MQKTPPFIWENHIQNGPYREQIIKALNIYSESWPEHISTSIFPMGNFLNAITQKLNTPTLKDITVEAKVKEMWTRYAAQGLVKGQYDFSKFESLFPVARERKRKITIFAGPTNSGKTYQAFQRLFQIHEYGGSVVYLGPLRLLALEAQERFQDQGIECDLITGEERIMAREDGEPAQARACTVEMLPTNHYFDAVLLDEGQLFTDEQRGWAWTSALVGAATTELFITCAPEAVPALKKLFAYLKEPVEVIDLERKNPLVVEGRLGRTDKIEEGTAFIVFSRKNALLWKEEIQEATGQQVAVLYGALSPEVRKQQAKLFRSGAAPYLVATDAIGLGLNLPIKRIVFTTTDKFDGESSGPVPDPLIRQIAGRAGRFKADVVSQEPGYVSVTGDADLNRIRKAMENKPKVLEPKFQIKPNSDQMEGIGVLLGAKSLGECFGSWEQMSFNSELFFRGSLEDIREAYTLLNPKTTMDFAEQYKFCCAPWPKGMLPSGRGSDIISPSWAVSCGEVLANGNYFPWDTSNIDLSNLLKAEDWAKLAGLYQWLSWHWPEHITADERIAAMRTAAECNERITELLSYRAKKKSRKGWE